MVFILGEWNYKPKDRLGKSSFDTIYKSGKIDS